MRDLPFSAHILSVRQILAWREPRFGTQWPWVTCSMSTLLRTFSISRLASGSAAPSSYPDCLFLLSITHLHTWGRPPRTPNGKLFL